MKALRILLYCAAFLALMAVVVWACRADETNLVTLNLTMPAERLTNGPIVIEYSLDFTNWTELATISVTVADTNSHNFFRAK